MPRSAAHALAWCPDTSTYQVRDPEHARTLAAIFGDTFTLTPGSQEWFDWLATLPSFAFTGKEGRFTARRETKQCGESYWVAYQRVGGKLRKKYLGGTGELTAEKLEEAAKSINVHACAHPATLSSEPVPAPPLSPQAWALIPEQVMRVDIGQTPKGTPYDDTFWIPDRSHFPLVQPTKERCPIHPTACWHLRDPSGQAWCTHPTCWRRCNLMQLGALISYHHLLGYDRGTFIAAGVESWATYAQEKDDVRIEFSLRQAIFYCANLDLQLPDLSEDARLHAPVYDAWKECRYI
jgi:hypothetical protein